MKYYLVLLLILGGVSFDSLLAADSCTDGVIAILGSFASAPEESVKSSQHYALFHDHIEKEMALCSSPFHEELFQGIPRYIDFGVFFSGSGEYFWLKESSEIYFPLRVATYISAMGGARELIGCAVLKCGDDGRLHSSFALLSQMPSQVEAYFTPSIEEYFKNIVLEGVPGSAFE